MNLKRKQKYAVRSIIFVIIFIIALVGYIRDQHNADKIEDAVEMHIIDVGQGDSVLFKTPMGNVLIDAGTNSSEQSLFDYLDSQGVYDFEYCIFTHPHEDHIGGADMIFENYDVRNVIISPAVTTTRTFEIFLDALERSEANVIEAVAGDKYKLGDLEMMIMGPTVVGNQRDLNNTSVITRISYGSVRMLFTGDAEKQQEGDILHSFSSLELNCDFLKMGHHGSSTSSSDKFIDAVSPSFAAISCGRDNDYGHPHREIIQLLEKRGIEYHRTDEEGSLVYICDGKSIWFAETLGILGR